VGGVKEITPMGGVARKGEITVKKKKGCKQGTVVRHFGSGRNKKEIGVFLKKRWLFNRGGGGLRSQKKQRILVGEDERVRRTGGKVQLGKKRSGEKKKNLFLKRGLEDKQGRGKNGTEEKSGRRVERGKTQKRTLGGDHN